MRRRNSRGITEPPNWDVAAKESRRKQLADKKVEFFLVFVGILCNSRYVPEVSARLKTLFGDM